MAWFSSSTTSTVELDNKISEATSESIPNGEVELSVALEITDLIRSKKVPAQQCMRSLKKRLTLVYANPNVLTSTLKLIDLCVKNSGYHFLVEISSREFIDYVIDFVFKVHYNTQDPEVQNNPAKMNVGSFILQLLQSWKIAFENQLQLGYVETVYNQLVSQKYEFPSSHDSFKVNSKFVDSQVAPDWIDNDSCMICYNAFSMINRKHHCRSCGGVFCNDHSLSRIPLVALGIMDPVRVCDNCFAKHTKANVKSGTLPKVSKTRSMPVEDDEDEELKRAIELSLQESQGFAVSAPAPQPQPQQPAPSTDENEEEDEDMKAAIAASLREYEQQESIKQQFNQQEQQSVPQFNQPSEPESDFYNISIPQYQSYQPNQFNQQQMQPVQQYQQYNQTGPDPQYPPQHAPQQPPKVEDLSQQEEENINLFITLMNSIKNDTKKKANILYDSNLNELHAKVITLKPKVNKSLRVAIEKYEAFLELNNKISTVSKLYDEFLESKLSMAYKNQNLNSAQPTGGPNYFQSEANQYSNFAEGQNTGVSQAYPNPQYPNEQVVGQQNSGYQQRYDYQSNVNPQNLNPQHTNPSVVNAQHTNPSSMNPQYTASSTTERRRSQYGTEPSMEPPTTTFNDQSEPQYTHNNEPRNYSYNSQSGYEEVQELTPEDSDREYLSKIPVSYSNEVDDQAIPYPPASPPLNNPENTDLHASLPANTNAVRRQSSTLPPHALEEANAKYPALENDEQYTSEPVESTFSNMSKFPQVPTTIDAESISSSKSKFIPEPEPLIEL